MVKRLLLWLLVLSAAGWFFQGYATSVNEVPIVRMEPRVVKSVLASGEVKHKVVKVPSGTYTGVVLYADSPLLVDQRIRVSVSDEEGRVLARSWMTTTRYDEDGRLRVGFPMLPFTVSANQRMRVSIEHVSGLPLLLSVLPQKEGEDGDRLVMSFRQPVPLPDRTKQGAMAGLVVLGAVVLIETYGASRMWWLYGGLLMIATYLALPGFWFSDAPLGIADWDYYFSLHHYYRHIILDLHQFPWWNPYTCGGTAGLADPEFPVLTLTFLWELLLGIPLGIRAAIFTSISVTAVGMLLLAKRIGMKPLSAFVAALATAFSTVSLLEIVEGHVNVFAAMWIPWIFLSWYAAYQSKVKGQTSKVHVLLCAVFLALTFYAGGIYLLMYTGLAFMFLVLLAAHHRVAMKVTLMAGVIAIGLAAFKLVPVALWLQEFPDKAYASSTITLPNLTQILLGRYVHGSYVIFSQDSGWHEYGAYIGAISLGLALVGLTVYRRQRLVLSLGVAVVAAILLASAGPGLKSFFDLLWFFPRSNISRFMLFAIIPIGLLAGLGLQAIRARAGRQQWLVFILAGFMAIDLLSLDAFLSGQSFVLPHVYPLVTAAPAPIAFTADRFDVHGTGSRTTRTYDAAVVGYGVFSYCSVLGPGTSSVQTIEDERGSDLVWIEGKENAVTLEHWSPNEVSMRVVAKTATNVGFNTNFAKGWWVDARRAKEVGNRVAFRIEPGEQVVTFSYHTPGAKLGGCITLITLGLVAVLWRRLLMIRDVGK